MRTAGCGRAANLLQILAAGDDVEDEHEEIGDGEAIYGAGRRLPERQFVEGPYST